MMKKVRQFLKPTRGKIVIFLIIAILANLNGVGYTERKVFIHYPPVEVANPLFYPSALYFNWGNIPPLTEVLMLTLRNLPGLLSGDVPALNGYPDPPILTFLGLFGLIHTPNISYWYLLSCLMIWLLRKSILKKNI